MSATVTGISRSSDSGKTWAVVNDSIYGSLATGDSIVLAGGPGVYRSTDRGVTWAKSDSGLGNVAGGISGVFRWDNVFYAGKARGGLFVSRDAGKIWTSISSDHPAFYINTLCLSGGYLIAGDIDSGIWRRPLAEILASTGPAPAPVPAGFTLLQNYPNPFNPATTIRYYLPQQSRVRLVVYDVLGRAVSELVNGEEPAGWNSAVWNAGVSSGVYYIRFEAVSINNPGARHISVRKALLLR